MEFWKKLFCPQLPAWAYGLECSVCKMSFLSAEAHMKHAKSIGLLGSHEGKIPKV